MVSIVIPCYNLFNLTEQCIAFIRKNTVLPIEIIVVDDGSTDETIHIEKRINIDTIIRNETNIGFGPSVNKGIDTAKYDYICIFNNDLFVASSWLEPLVKTLDENEKYGMVTGTMWSLEKTNMTIETFISKENKGMLRDDIQKIPYVFFIWHKEAPWLFRKSVFETIGNFDEQFAPAQYEDWDIQIRMAKAGIIYGKASNSISYHLTSKTQQQMHPKWGEYAQANRQKFHDKWGALAEINMQKLCDNTKPK